MTRQDSVHRVASDPAAFDEAVERVAFDFAPSRREFLVVLGAGLLITVCDPGVHGGVPGRGAGRAGNGGGGGGTVAARLHIDKDGAITVMTGKVEGGQGARAELTAAAAEELRVSPAAVKLIMADTALVPNDGVTAGSRTTPSTVPAVRQGAAAARELLIGLAAKAWQVGQVEVQLRDGKAVHEASKREVGYGELAASDDAAKAFGGAAPANVTLTAVKEWKVLGKPLARPDARQLVTGGHRYPSDIVRPKMLYGKVLRRPSYGAKLTTIDVAPARKLAETTVVQDGDFVGVAAPTTFAAEQALAAIARTAKWDQPAHPASDTLFAHLRQGVRGGAPANPFAGDLPKAAKSLKQSYEVAYVQHAPLEPRAAVAEWEGEKVTVWSGTQNPFGVRSELARAFRVGEDQVRVIVPDFGSGFGGKHTGEAAIEAARLAKGAGRVVSLRWTRAEEFTWAYFRPAALIDIEAGLDAGGAITSWHFVNINSGNASIETPYQIAKAKSQYVDSDPPLRHGSYRSLAATANTFARECFMDELAEAAGQDSLAFRLAHLGNPRLKAVLSEAAKQFDWAGRVAKKERNVGIGLACGTDKGSVVAACVEVTIEHGAIAVRRVCEAFECGAILNPANLLSQVQGAIVMGMGPALREEMRFAKGVMKNDGFSSYLAPRFADVPELDIHLLDRPDQPSAGAGETPIIAVAPAIANAVWRITGQRARSMPIRLPEGAGGR